MRDWVMQPIVGFGNDGPGQKWTRLVLSVWYLLLKNACARWLAKNTDVVPDRNKHTNQCQNMATEVSTEKSCIISTACPNKKHPPEQIMTNLVPCIDLNSTLTKNALIQYSAQQNTRCFSQTRKTARSFIVVFAFPKADWVRKWKIPRVHYWLVELRTVS